MEFTRGYRPSKKMNLASLIDVIFILMVFFMVSSHFEEINTVNLNSIANKESSASNEPLEFNNNITIKVLNEAFIEMNNQKYNYVELSKKFKRLVYFDNQINVTIDSESDANVQSLIKAIDALKKAGVKNLSFY